jgi:hypothetical protein
MAKKVYSGHALTEVCLSTIQTKDKYERQLNSFKILSDRYRVLSEFDETIDIMNEAEKMKNMSKVIT